MPFENSSFKRSNDIAHKCVVSFRSYDIIVGKFSHTLLVLHAVFRKYTKIVEYTKENRLAARAIVRTGRYVGISRSCLSVFKMGGGIFA